MKCDLEYDFHDLEKMPKHVEMVRTKCQPKSWDGRNANHRDKSGQNANLWLALCPVGILSAHHICREVGGCTQESWMFSNLIEPPTCLEVGAYLTTCVRITASTTLNDLW